MAASMLLSCCVVILDIIAYVIYNWDLIIGKAQPYRASWAVWFFLSILNSASYFFTSGDIVKTLLSIENTVSCGITFTFAFFIGRGRPFQKDEKWSLSTGVVGGIVWWIFRKAFYANAIMQVATIISSYSILIGLLKDPKSQRPFPWFLWSIVYTFFVIVVLLRWDGKWQTLVYPMNYMLLHIGVLTLTLRKSPISSE